MSRRIGVWGSQGEPRGTAALSGLGFDWVCLDAQHGLHDDRSVRESLALRRERAVPVLVRVLANTPAHIGRALDAGADGVIVPLVQDTQDAQAAVQAAHHPPVGTRSFGPTAGVDYPQRPFVAVMVETRSALEQVDLIAATPELDMIFLGPFDLSLALGMDIETLVADTSDDSPLSRVLAACEGAGIAAGAFGGNPERARLLLDRGFDWVAITSDVDLLEAGAAAARARLG